MKRTIKVTISAAGKGLLTERSTFDLLPMENQTALATYKRIVDAVMAIICPRNRKGSGVAGTSVRDCKTVEEKVAFIVAKWGGHAGVTGKVEDLLDLISDAIDDEQDRRKTDAGKMRKLAELLWFVVSGCRNGSIKAKPVVERDPEATELVPVSLEEYITKKLEECGIEIEPKQKEAA